MRPIRCFLLVLPLAVILSGASAWLLAQDKPKADLTKTLMIERPAVEVLVNSSPAPQLDAPAAAVAAGSRTIVTPDVAAQLLVKVQLARLADRGKGRVEMPLKEVIADRGKYEVEVPLKEVIADRGKSDVEVPLKEVIAGRGYGAGTPPPSETAFVNPKVEPGKVRWHADFAAACAAAQQSGKPVLLFQMMGKLDDRFC